MSALLPAAAPGALFVGACPGLRTLGSSAATAGPARAQAAVVAGWCRIVADGFLGALSGRRAKA